MMGRRAVAVAPPHCSGGAGAAELTRAGDARTPGAGHEGGEEEVAGGGGAAEPGGGGAEAARGGAAGVARAAPGASGEPGSPRQPAACMLAHLSPLCPPPKTYAQRTALSPAARAPFCTAPPPPAAVGRGSSRPTRHAGGLAGSGRSGRRWSLRRNEGLLGGTRPSPRQTGPASWSGPRSTTVVCSCSAVSKTLSGSIVYCSMSACSREWVRDSGLGVGAAARRVQPPAGAATTAPSWGSAASWPAVGGREE